MTDKTKADVSVHVKDTKPNGLKGSEQHHDLKRKDEEAPSKPSED